MKEIKLILPAQAAKMGGDLGAILGQHGVNIVKFCKEFNNISTNYEYNLLIKVCLILEDSSNFKIRLLGPNSTFLVRNFSKGEKIVKLLDLYKMTLVKKKNNTNLTELSILKSLESTLKSMRYKISYE